MAPTATKISTMPCDTRGEREHHRGPHPEPAGAQTVGEQTEPERSRG